MDVIGLQHVITVEMLMFYFVNFEIFKACIPMMDIFYPTLWSQ